MKEKLLSALNHWLKRQLSAAWNQWRFFLLIAKQESALVATLETKTNSIMMATANRLRRQGKL